MSYPALRIFLDPRVRQLALRLLRRSSRNSRPISLGRYNPRLLNSFPGYGYSAARGYRVPRSQNTILLPLYGSPKATTRVEPLIVPGSIRFAWENEHELPRHLPSMSLRAPRNTGKYKSLRAPIPVAELAIRAGGIPPSGRFRPEPNRRRHDAKLNIGYNRLLRFVNQTYGNYSELLELWDAYSRNTGFLNIGTALALQQAVDVAYGARSGYLRDYLYRDNWRLPVGFDTLSRLWR